MRSLAVPAIGMAALLGCTPTPVVKPVSAAVAEEPQAHTRFHMRDGGLYVLDSWTAKGDEILGEGRRYDVERAMVAWGKLSLRRADVALVETTEQKLNPALIPMLLVTGASAGLTVGCALNPKACFGSCPTFYVPGDDGAWKLQAEGFSRSIAKALEADDLDDLPDARPREGAITLSMRNEALETHAVRAVSLLVVRGPEGSKVLHGFGQRSGFFAVGKEAPPIACEAEGQACSALSARDDRELALTSDGRDLLARTSVTLRYAPPGKSSAALVLTARNSLMSTFVLYHMMALHGRAAGEFIAQIERGDLATIGDLLGFSGRLGDIEVSFRQGEGAFTPAGGLGYIGPIARATRGLELRGLSPGEPVEIKLTFERAHWRLDAALLAPVVADNLPSIEVAPEVVEARLSAPQPAERSLRGEGEHLITLPGDEVVIRFPLPGRGEGGATGYFLHSRGYYYEWMREAWLKDEDQDKARAYLHDPSRAYRELAPLYRSLEPSMESIFRASRFERKEAP